MNSKIYKYIQAHFSQHPKDVDKLIVSTFFKKNNIEVKNNKFLKDYLIKESNKEQTAKLNEFIVLIEKHYKQVTIETMIELFEFVISPADRIITGAVYTPNNVREFIVGNILNNEHQIGEDWNVCDIACGCGGFLFTLAKHLKENTHRSYEYIYRNYIFGLDIKRYCIDRSKILLSTLAVVNGEDEKEFHFNLFTGNALSFKWPEKIRNFTGFNCIVGNPPYVCSRKIEKSSKKFLEKYEVCSSGHPDLYIPFFQIGLELLKPQGFLGFITMNSFFKSLNGRALRSYFQANSFNFRIIDFGTLQVFQKKSTYTCICLLQKNVSDSIQYKRLDAINDLIRVPHVFTLIPYSSLKSHNGWNLLSTDLISKIESVGTPFSEKYTTRNGIATLKNEIYIFTPVKEDTDFFYLQNESLYAIEKRICKEIVNPNKLANQTSLKSIREKFIFPYEFVDGKAVILSEKKLKDLFPLTHKYLSSKKSQLSKRDNGEGKYPEWFAFGRTQSLEKSKYKLFFPHITPHIPNYIINTDENLYFYNGIAVIGSNKRELMLLQKVMSSRIFWFYIESTSKPYSAGYLSLSKNYIKDFGVYNFSEEDINYILKEDDVNSLNSFIESKYEVDLR